MFSRKDVYDYDDVYDEDDQGYYEDFDTSEDPEEVIEKMRGTVAKGDCIYCGEKHTMSYEGDVCFVCSECKKSIHEDLYYLWLAGYNIDLDDDEYDEDDEDFEDDEDDEDFEDDELEDEDYLDGDELEDEDYLDDDDFEEKENKDTK